MKIKPAWADRAEATIIPEKPLKHDFQFQCIDCDNAADTLHKGTAYCRPCYDQRAVYGQKGGLIN